MEASLFFCTGFSKLVLPLELPTMLKKGITGSFGAIGNVDSLRLITRLMFDY